MKHLTESEIALHYYGDDDDSLAVEQHLAECAQCRNDFEQVKAVLGAVNLPVPERPAGYETDVWNNLRAHLPEKRTASRWAWLAMPQRWAVAGALAVLLVIAFGLGRWSQRTPANGATGTTKTVADAAVRDRVLLVAVGDHLDRSQMILVELVNAQSSGKSVDISAQQEDARRLLDDNRLYRQTAAQVHDRAVGDVLDQLETLLVDLSHQPSTVSESEFEDIKRRIEAQGILFKVRIIGSAVREREKQMRAAPTGQTPRSKT
jgi:hypothetical protein